MHEAVAKQAPFDSAEGTFPFRGDGRARGEDEPLLVIGSGRAPVNGTPATSLAPAPCWVRGSCG